MAYETTASTKPLTDAVIEIFRIADRNVRGAERILEQLNEIIDAAERGKASYRENVMTAQRAELESLRAAAKAYDPR